MKKASIIICVFLGCLVGHGWAARPSVSELLDELDEMIIQKKQYHARKEDKLKYLKEAFHMASDLQKSMRSVAIFSGIFTLSDRLGPVLCE